jgi:hypothetical protein
MKAKAAMSIAPPTPPQPIPPKAPLMLRVRDDLLVAVIIILAITSAICTGVIATVMVIDRVARPAAVVPEAPKKPDVPAKPDTPKGPVAPEKPVNPEPFNPIPPPVPPTPAPTTPFGEATREYHNGLAAQLRSLGDQVDSGKLKTGADVATAARANAEPMKAEFYRAASALDGK